MPEGQHISGPMAVLSIVNGMIGGLILLLPVMALQAGWLLTLIVIVLTGLISYYSCFLCLYHTGQQADLDVAILKHFGGRRWLKVFYEACILATLLLILFLYYELIVLQWIGLAPSHQYTPWNPLLNMVALLGLALVIKFKEIGATLMAYGVASIAAYLLFVTWVVGSEEDAQDTKELAAFGGNGMDLAAALAQAFAIQFFFIPVLKKNRKTGKHKFYLLMAFILGALAYAYIAFMGSYGILHRDYFEKDGKTERTIEGYFEAGTWEVNAIEVIYLVHLYSVYPEYLIIGKKRFFSIFGLQESEVGEVNRNELVFMVSILGMCLVIALMRVSLREIIEFNGAVLGFFFIYFFPVAIHLKCCFMKKPQPEEQVVDAVPQESPQNQHYVEMIEEDKHAKNTPDGVIVSEKGFNQKAATAGKESEGRTVVEPQSAKICEGHSRMASRGQKGCQLLAMGAMLVTGLTIMLQGVVEMLKGDV